MQDHKNSVEPRRQSNNRGQQTSPHTNPAQEGVRKVLHDAPTITGAIVHTPVSVGVARQLRRQRVHARRMLRLLRDFYEFGLLRDRARQSSALPVGCVLAVRYQSR